MGLVRCLHTNHVDEQLTKRIANIERKNDDDSKKLNIILIYFQSSTLFLLACSFMLDVGIYSTQLCYFVQFYGRIISNNFLLACSFMLDVGICSTQLCYFVQFYGRIISNNCIYLYSIGH
jgi:hypothetical protein